MADTLITPLNDSFVDFDVLGTVDPETFAVSDISHYAKWSQEVRRQREPLDGGSIDWVVMRNRLSMLGTRNKRLVGAALQELSRRLDFRAIEGFAERMIFREFYPRGLTALDDFNEVTLGTRPTMSHATARQEVASLLNSINLGSLMETVETQRRPNRHPTPTATRLDGDGAARNAVPDFLRVGKGAKRAGRPVNWGDCTTRLTATCAAWPYKSCARGLSMNVMIGAAVYLVLALAVVVGIRGVFQKRFLDERAPPPWAGL